MSRKQLPFWLALLLTLLAAVTLLPGCKSLPSAPQMATGNGIAAAIAESEVIADQAVALEKMTDGEAKARVGIIKIVNERQTQKLIQARADNITAEEAHAKALDTERGKVGTAERKYAALEAQWYVVAGRFIQWLIVVALAVWAVLGVLAVVLIHLSPLGWGLTFGKFLINFLPLSHPFATWAKRVA